MNDIINFYTITALFLVFGVSAWIITFSFLKKDSCFKGMHTLTIKYTITEISIALIIKIFHMDSIVLYLIIQIFFALFFTWRYIVLYVNINRKPKSNTVSWDNIKKNLQKISKNAAKLPTMTQTEVKADINQLIELINNSPTYTSDATHHIEKKISDGIDALADYITLMLETHNLDSSIVSDKVIRLNRLVNERNEL